MDAKGETPDSKESKQWESRMKDMLAKVFSHNVKDKHLGGLAMAVAQKLRMLLPDWLRGMLPGDDEWYAAVRDDNDDAKYRQSCATNHWDYEKLKDLSDKERRREEGAQDLWKALYDIELEKGKTESEAHATADGAARTLREPAAPRREYGLIASEKKHLEAKDGTHGDPADFEYTSSAFWGFFGPEFITTEVLGAPAHDDHAPRHRGDDRDPGQACSETTRRENADGTVTTESWSASAAQMNFKEGELTLRQPRHGSIRRTRRRRTSRCAPARVFETKLGNDTLSITYSFEGGGGGGGGVEIGSGAGALATGGLKLYGYLIKIPLKLIFTSTETLIVGPALLCPAVLPGRRHLRRGGRLDRGQERHVGRHWRASGNSSLPSPSAASPSSRPSAIWSPTTPNFVVSTLEAIHGALQLDATGAISGTYTVNGEVSETIHAQGMIKLATNRGAAPRPSRRRQGQESTRWRSPPSASSRRSRSGISDETVIKGSYFPFGLRVQVARRAVLGRDLHPAGIVVPREGAREIFGVVADFIETYKAQRAAEPKPGEPDPRPTRTWRKAWLAIDRGLAGWSPAAVAARRGPRRTRRCRSSCTGCAARRCRPAWAPRDRWRRPSPPSRRSNIIGVALRPGGQTLIVRAGCEPRLHERLALRHPR
jgi:hypothetical protein